MNNKSIVLIEVIIIVVLLAIIALGIATYVTEGLRYNISNINQDKALGMAQAGIMRAIVDYKDDGRWSAAENVNVVEGLYYHIGGEKANFLLVDASSPRVAGQELHNIPISNINTTNSIRITNMVVSWSFGGSLRMVWVADGSPVWSGTKSSPANLDIVDVTIPAATAYTALRDQAWQFSSNIPSGFSMTVTFIFSDGSSQKVIIAQNQRAGNKEFSIKSTGEVRSGSKVEARRTLIATYDVKVNRITSWEETQDHIRPLIIPIE